MLVKEQAMERLVTNLPGDSYALANLCAHNPADFNGERDVYIAIEDTIYLSRQVDSCLEGHIGFGFVQRNKHRLALNDTVKVKQVKIERHPLKHVAITFTKRKSKPNTIETVHEEDFKEALVRSMKNHYFHDNQVLVLQIHNANYILDIRTKGGGFIGPKTRVDLVSSSINLTLISSKTLKRDLFRDDYNFEEIGIGGLDKELINIFRRALSTRAINPSIVKKMGIKHVKGILLYGPPGTGKTLIARNIGKLLTPTPPKIVNGPEILNKYVGQSEENIRNLFDDAKRDYETNREHAQLHVIIFDEIDAICRSRGGQGTQSSVTDSLVNQLLSMIQGVHELDNIFIIAMTNRKDLLDPALIRAGRLEIHIEISLPDIEGRNQILRIHTKKMSNAHMIGPNVDLTKIAELTENFSGAELETVVKNASSYAIHELLASTKDKIRDEDVTVKMEDFLRAVDEIEPTFGNFNKEIKSLLPLHYVHSTPKNREIYKKIIEIAKNGSRVNTMMVYGENGTGKTTLVCQAAYDLKVQYTRVVRPIDVVAMTEDGKAKYLTNIFMDAHLSEKSLIVLDDIEVLINFANLDYNVSFSNKLYQTLITLLKTPPKDPSHTLTVIVTCGDDKLRGILERSFDSLFELDKILPQEVYDVAHRLGIDLSGEIVQPITIKSLVTL